MSLPGGGRTMLRSGGSHGFGVAREYHKGWRCERTWTSDQGRMGGVSVEGGWYSRIVWGVSKESTKVTSPLRDEKMFLVAEETTIGSFEFGIRWLRVDESMSKLTV
jgi:hypothetical protein